MRPLCDRLSRCLIPLTLALPLHALADDPLAGFKPDGITVELQPPAECDLVKRRPEKHGEGYNCPRTEALKHAPDLLPMYRQLNRPDVLRRLAQSNVAPPCAIRRRSAIRSGGWPAGKFAISAWWRTSARPSGSALVRAC